MKKNYIISLLKLVAVLLLIFRLPAANAAKFNFASTDVFATVLATMADGDTLVLTTPGTTAYYTTLNGAISKSITIMADPTLTSRPVLSTNSVGACFTPTATVAFTKIEFLGIEAFAMAPTDVVTDSRYFLDGRMTTGSVSILKFKNCYIHGYSRCVVRADGSTPAFTNFVVDSCVFSDNSIGAASYPLFGLKSATITNISITNSTFYNSPGNVMTYSKTNALTFLMKNCNIMDCGSYKTRVLSSGVYADSNPGRLIDFTAAANAASTFTVENCIISGKYTNKENRPLLDQANTGNYAGSNIVRFNTATAANVNFMNSILLDNTFNTPAAPGGTYTPVTCTSLISYLPTWNIITDPNTITGIGDLRWKLNQDTILTDLKVDGATITGFSSYKFNYNIVLPNGTTIIPTIAATANNATVTLLTTQAATVKSAGTIVIAAADGITPRKTYTVNFSVVPSSDAALKDIKVDGASVANFASGTYIYNILLPAGTKTKPVVSATTNEPNATTIITQSDSVVGAATVVVTAEDAATKLTYTINFSVIPSLVADRSNLYFDDLNVKDSIIVSGAYLTADVTLSVPAGITVNPASIPAASATDVKVYVTYDGTSVVNDTISITSGALTKKVAVKASSNNSCYTPLFPKGNLIANPTFNTLTGYVGWGNKGLNTDPTKSYCGKNCGQIIGTDICWPNGGSMDVNITLKPNTKYIVRAMVKTMDGSFELSIGKSNGTAADINNFFDTKGEWKPFSFTFTSGAIVTGAGCYFNNCSGSTGKVGYIDNLEIFEYPKVNVSSASVSFLGAETKKVTVTGVNLSKDITITAQAGFSVTPSTLLPTVAGEEISITFNGLANSSGYVYFTSDSIKDSIQVIGTIKSTDATLKDLTVKGTTITGFVAGTTTYSVMLPFGTTVVPVVAAVVNEPNATTVITQATSVNGSAAVEVTAQDGTTKITYTINFSVNPVGNPTLSDNSLVLVKPTISSADFMVEFTGKLGKISVIDSRGKLISSKIASKSTETISVPSAGIYFIQINVNGTVKTVKVVKTN